jgi:hypothetical protein
MGTFQLAPVPVVMLTLPTGLPGCRLGYVCHHSDGSHDQSVQCGPGSGGDQEVGPLLVHADGAGLPLHHWPALSSGAWAS